nr:hypothetical protein [Tanacetum cinerariifolium]
KVSKVFWIALQGVWGEIDRIDPNPMKCAEDINIQKSDLNKNFSSFFMEWIIACATVRKEAAHQNILGATSNESQGIATGLIVGSGETEGVGLAIKGYRRNDGKKSFVKEDKSHLTCEECGMTKHTKEQCFWIVKNKRENDKIGTKPDQIKKKREAWRSVAKRGEAWRS